VTCNGHISILPKVGNNLGELNVIVLVAGMPRSGSTFSYNIVRELLQRRGVVRGEHAYTLSSVVEDDTKADHVILKAHDADKLTLGLIKLRAVKAICTVRKPEDAVASYMQTFGFELNESVDAMFRWLEMFERLRDYALVVPYNDIDSHPVRAAFRIGRAVCPDARALEVLRIARRYSKAQIAKLTADMRPDDEGAEKLSFSYYDKKTFFHRRHVSSLLSKPAHERIGEEAVSVIRSRLNKWIDADGNLRLTAVPASSLKI
jgi:hypothetical protein